MGPRRKEEGGEGREQKRKSERRSLEQTYDNLAYDNHHSFNKHLLSTYYMPGAVLVLREQI